jgi:hypothetical protein
MILQAYKRRFARLLMESLVLAVGPGQEQAGHTFLYLTRVTGLIFVNDL